MAFDGTTVYALTRELDRTLSGGHINKIIQPEKDALLFTIKNNKETYRLFISANASLPLIYLTDQNRTAPDIAPTFCMVLRKYLSSARILSITQPGLERIIDISFEHLDELGDVCRKVIHAELMGKHSNIILCGEDGTIIDSIKHVSALVSSVREVLPGRTWFIPEQSGKHDPLTVTEDVFLSDIMTRPCSIGGALCSSLTGISKTIAVHICTEASLDADTPCDALSADLKLHLFRNFERTTDMLQSSSFECNSYLKCGEPADFAVIPLSQYSDCEVKNYASVSELLREYYEAKDLLGRIRQKTSDLRKLISNLIDRNVKKAELQGKQLKDTEKRDKYRIFGELITAYGYSVQQGEKQMTATDYYSGEEVTIPLDPQIPVMDNAKKYFDRYNKLKRTFEATTRLLEETENDIFYLRSVLLSLDNAVTEADLKEIRRELSDCGYVKAPAVKGKKPEKRSASKGQPFHYLSRDGYDIYVGKNNYQNDELTFKLAQGSDWWFHAKHAAGSHVILKYKGEDIPDSAFEDAARLAAFYSSAGRSEKVEIDYAPKKQIKKPNGAKPGFVVYYTNYSMLIDSDISGLKLLS